VSPKLSASTRASDGQALRYDIDDRRAARVNGAPILTLHGLVSSAQHWRYFSQHFAALRPVVSWDYPGHGGQAAPPSRPASIEQFADDAAAIAAAAALGPVVAVGLSFGVQVALELYRRHAAQVRALVLICGTPGHPLDRLTAAPGLRKALSSAARSFGRHRALAQPLLGLLGTSLGTRAARELAYVSGGAHRASCPAEVLDSLFAHVAGLDPQLVGDAVASYFEHSAQDMLSTIAVPTLILAGDRDQLTPVTTAQRMQRAIAGSELVVFPGHTHLVQVEAPAAVHAAIDAFLRAHRL
jgi:pimeloyl-ACP methyl ester carboxylesterase